jgi:hypothetical protein
MFVDYGSYVKHRILASYSSVVMPSSQGPCPLSISPQHLVLGGGISSSPIPFWVHPRTAELGNNVAKQTKNKSR